MFWHLDRPSQHPALWQEASVGAVSYDQLHSACQVFAQSLNARFGRRSLGLIGMANDLGSVTAYLGALQANAPVILVDPKMDPALWQSLVDIYAPEWLVWPQGQTVPEGWTPEAQSSPNGPPLSLPWHPPSAPNLNDKLALMLSTSGSTGSPKLVRLSYDNLEANAHSIASYLGLLAQDRAITSLPLQYCYGLSVLNSHLKVGGSVILTEQTVMQRAFWDMFRRYGVSFLAGVPFTYEMLERLRFETMDLPSLRILTQAGGRLPPERVARMEQLAQSRGWSFFVMYGQTEATARMAYMPPHRLRDKPGSIGIAIPGGRLEIDSHAENEIVYRGPNVMLGYAQKRDDLALGDQMGGVLRTGDLGVVDEEGFFTVTGRKSRFLKLFGQRISLGDVEERLQQSLGTTVACYGTDSLLYVALDRAEAVEHACQMIKDRYHLHGSCLKVFYADPLPRLPSGKVDYESLRRMQVS